MQETSGLRDLNSDRIHAKSWPFRAREIYFGRGALSLFLLFSFLGFLALCKFQLVDLRGLVSTDEYFASACAVRGLAEHWVPVFGCHNNKGPIIFLVYELIFGAFGYYNFLATKIVTYLVCGSYVFVLARGAFRLSGWPGALITSGLTLLCLSSNILNMALRTDLVGALFLAMALALLSEERSRQSPKLIALSGVLIGAAIMTKQHFVLAVPAVILWLFFEERPATRRQWFRILRLVLAFGLCVVLPFLVFWLIFQLQGNAKPFLTSVFLYPMVYGTHHLSGFTDWIKRLLSLFAALDYNLVLISVGVASAVTVAFRSSRLTVWHGTQLAALRLNALVAGCLLFFFIFAPLWWPYYIVGFSPPLLMLAGSLAGDAWRRMEKERPEILPPLGAGFAVVALILAAHTWKSNGDYKRGEISLPASVLHSVGSQARYAFQMGVQPDFYAAGDFVPASSVQFLWALPGTPNTLVFTRPRPGSFVGRILENAQAENERQLLEDFRLTPPSIVLLESNWVGTQKPSGWVEIPLLRDYLQTHCKSPSQIVDANLIFLLYQCGEPSADRDR